MATQAPQGWSGVPIEAIIDRELGSNPEIRSGLSAYAAAMDAFRASGDGTAFITAVLDHAATQHRGQGHQSARFVTFSDGSANFLFDMTEDRAVVVWGVSQATAAGTRDNAYHAGYPRAGDGLDKGHAWSHAQGGREGGPNYFRQAARLNRAISTNGKLWRAIETYLAANAGLSAFIRLIYGPGNLSDQPNEVEYGIVSATGQFRAVVFPND